VVVTSVAAGSPADEAGIRAGNIILEVDRQPIHSVAEYEKRIEQAADKDSVLLLIKTPRGNRFAMVRMEKR
jgi:serine protease Do